MQKPAVRCKKGDRFRTSQVPSRDDGAKEALFRDNLHLVNMIVGKLVMDLPPHADIDDLYSAGRIGLWDAVRRYDPAKGASFDTYARWRIRGAVMDELRRIDPLPRTIRERQQAAEQAVWNMRSEGKEPSLGDVAVQLGIPVHDLTVSVVPLWECGFDDTPPEEIFADERIPAPFWGALIADDMTVINEVISTLSANAQQAIHLYFFDYYTLRQIGDAFGLTESRVSQIIKQSIEIIQARFARMEHTRATAL